MVLIKKMRIRQLFCNIMVIFIATLVTSGCVKIEENRGYVKGVGAKVERIKIGVTDKNDVLYLLGSPSSKSTFGEDIWYYIGLKMQRSAYLQPEVTDEDILIISFNKDEIVEDVTRKGAEDRRNITISEESTPTEGNKMTVLEQLLGNLGRYNATQ